VAGRGHLLTEDTVRLETVLALGDAGVEPGRLKIEVLTPVLLKGKLDLVLDPLVGSRNDRKRLPGPFQDSWTADQVRH
jgi:hypothetical protein